MPVRPPSLGYLSNIAARLFVRSLERRLGGGTVGHMPVFVALEGHDSLSQSELARRAEVEQPTMAATLKRMERDGLVVRTPDPEDGRSARVSLTDRGRQRAAEAFAAADAVTAMATAELSEDERAQLLALFARVIAALRADRD